MRLFSELEQDVVATLGVSSEEAAAKIGSAVDDVCDVVGDCFEAVASELTFQPRGDCFELFGFDFMLDEDWGVWLLEVNAEPDFRYNINAMQIQRNAMQCNAILRVGFCTCHSS